MIYPLAFIKMSTISTNWAYFTICGIWGDHANEIYCSIVTPHHLIIKIFHWRSYLVPSYLNIGKITFKQREIRYLTNVRWKASHQRCMMNVIINGLTVSKFLIMKFFLWRPYLVKITPVSNTPKKNPPLTPRPYFFQK